MTDKLLDKTPEQLENSLRRMHEDNQAQYQTLAEDCKPCPQFKFPDTLDRTKPLVVTTENLFPEDNLTWEEFMELSPCKNYPPEEPSK